MNIVTTEEMMAMAVLRGDRAAAMALADSLCGDLANTVKKIPPVRRITCNMDRLRVVCRTYPELGGDVKVDVSRLEQCVQNWLRGDGPLTLVGMTVELYELSEPAARPAPELMEKIKQVHTARQQAVSEDITTPHPCAHCRKPILQGHFLEEIDGKDVFTCSEACRAAAGVAKLRMVAKVTERGEPFPEQAEGSWRDRGTLL